MDAQHTFTLTFTVGTTMKEIHDAVIRTMLQHTRSNRLRAAQLLQINPRTIRRHGIIQMRAADLAGQIEQPAGFERQAEDAERDLVAAHDLDALQLLQEIPDRTGLLQRPCAIGRPRPEAEHHPGMIQTHDSARRENHREPGESRGQQSLWPAPANNDGRRRERHIR